MSVATVQQHLQASGLNESIEIGPYLSKLCDSLASSMVGDRRPLSIRVQATSGAATSGAAVSLGLIVTELVINALKHAFPSGETGEIVVSYDARGSGWRLSVSETARALQRSAMRGHTPASARALLKRWLVNSMPRCGNLVACRARPSQLLQAQQRKAPSDVQVMTWPAGLFAEMIDRLRL